MAKHRKRSANSVQRLHRLILPFFYWRYHEDNDDSPLVTHQNYRGPMIPKTMDEIEYQVQNTSFIWQCVTITYCRDNWGKEYRQFGFGRTEHALKIVDEPIEALLSTTIHYAENTLNAKHIYARGVVLAPWSKHHKDLMPAVSKVRKGLHLTDEELNDIRDYLNDPATLLEATLPDVDDEIRDLLQQG